MNEHEACNAFLEVIALLNNGPDHSSSYGIESLPDALCIGESLRLYFSGNSTNTVPPQPAEHWHIRQIPIEGDWVLPIKKAAHRWFFEQRFSPSLQRDYVRDDFVDRFLQHLCALVGAATACRVETSPPMWYECVWDDFAFSTCGNFWLLHFGFSD